MWRGSVLNLAQGSFWPLSTCPASPPTLLSAAQVILQILDNFKHCSTLSLCQEHLPFAG